MQVARLEAIFRALNEAQAEYLVVGGLPSLPTVDADKLTILKSIQDESS